MKASYTLLVLSIFSGTVYGFYGNQLPYAGGPCFAGEYAPNPANRASFLQCDNGAFIAKMCGPGTVWNPAINACDFPYNVKYSSPAPVVSYNRGPAIQQLPVQNYQNNPNYYQQQINPNYQQNNPNYQQINPNRLPYQQQSINPNYVYPNNQNYRPNYPGYLSSSSQNTAANVYQYAK